MKVRIFKGEDGLWYWHILAKNGKKMCGSEGYKKKSSIINTVNSLKKSLAKAPIVLLSS